MKTTLATKETANPKWHIIDATDMVLGRLAVKIANILRGRHKPIYTPHEDTGDFVIVINASKVKVTGKKADDKSYMFFTGYMGTEKHRSFSYFLEKNPAFIIEHAVKGMLPRNRLSRAMLKKLKVYAHDEHPHAAQEPIPFKA